MGEVLRNNLPPREGDLPSQETIDDKKNFSLRNFSGFLIYLVQMPGVRAFTNPKRKNSYTVIVIKPVSIKGTRFTNSPSGLIAEVEP